MLTVKNKKKFLNADEQKIKKKIILNDDNKKNDNDDNDDDISTEYLVVHICQNRQWI